MSSARMFSSQATWSSAQTTWALVPASFIAARRRASLDCGVSPAKRRGCEVTGARLSAGRSSQMASMGLPRRNSTLMPCGARAFSKSAAAAIDTTLASTPSTCPGRSCLTIQAVIVGVPGSPMRISSMSEPASSLLAWKK
jgi:hypothetical protein